MWVPITLLLSHLATTPVTSAAEGLWRPSDLSRADLPLPDGVDRAEVAALAELGSGPLSAVVDLGGCSGAFVSEEGLLVTAYHCLWNALRAASLDGENLIDEGFHAKTRGAERWGGAGLTARRTVAMTEVTDQVLAGTEGADPSDRAERMAKNISKMVRSCETSGNRCEVEGFDHDTSWVLIEREVLSDVRIVLTPPRDVGYFGGDADNWRWPRHSGDFAFVRVYADRDNRSPGYDAHHKPYRPPHHLTVGRGPAPGDFVAVAGYPAQTWRWMGAPQLDHTARHQLPRDLRITSELLDVYRRVASAHPELNTKLQPPILSLENRRLYLEGGIASLERGLAVDLRWHRDRSLERWIMGAAERTEQWGPVVKDLRVLAEKVESTGERDALFGQLRARSALLGAATRIERWSREQQKSPATRAAGYRRADGDELIRWLDQLADRYHQAIDRPVLRHLLLAALALPKEQRIDQLHVWFDKLPHQGTVEQRLDAELEVLYADERTLLDATRRARLIASNPKKLAEIGGPWFRLASALQDFAEDRDVVQQALDAQWAEVQPRYMSALLAWMGTRKDAPPFYSDANRTLRVSFGHVQGFEPEDGIVAHPRTTVAGMRRKASSHRYAAPEPLLQLALRSSYSEYADPQLEDVPVNFLSTADTTVGNSGSPTFTLDGQWVGILFDGNYEGMATDWVFLPEVTRSIHTDASYVLWYLTEVSKATTLLQELDVKKRR